MPEDILDPLELGQPGGDPDPAALGTAGGDPNPDPDAIEIVRGDERHSIRREVAQEIADATGRTIEDVQRALQLGFDGTRLYSDLRENTTREQDRITRAWAQLDERERQLAARPAPAQPRPNVQPLTRPPAEDVHGTLGYLTDRFERALPHLERIPLLEEQLTETRATLTAAEEAREIATERAESLHAYNEVAEQWSKDGRKLPPYDMLLGQLKRIPVSDDANLSWLEVWDQVGWMVGGPAIYRNAKRAATLDITKPEARVTVPVGRAPGAARVPAAASAPGDGDNPTDAELAAEEAALRGVSLQSAFGSRRTV